MAAKNITPIAIVPLNKATIENWREWASEKRQTLTSERSVKHYRRLVSILRRAKTEVRLASSEEAYFFAKALLKEQKRTGTVYVQAYFLMALKMALPQPQQNANGDPVYHTVKVRFGGERHHIGNVIHRHTSPACTDLRLNSPEDFERATNAIRFMQSQGLNAKACVAHLGYLEAKRPHFEAIHAVVNMMSTVLDQCQKADAYDGPEVQEISRLMPAKSKATKVQSTSVNAKKKAKKKTAKKKVAKKVAAKKAATKETAEKPVTPVTPDDWAAPTPAPAASDAPATPAFD